MLTHLASGGMGQVYLAKATGLGGFERKVVVKTLETESSDEDVLVSMFLDEARLLGALHHQYISPIYEVGRDEDGRYFLVMDYVRGETAEAVWRASNDRGVPLPLAFGVSAVAAVASALDYAHALCAADGTPLGIVHRDVSLSNVMIGDEGAVKLIDFGIAKFKNRTSSTQTGSLKGKLGYLAPEQVLNNRVDHRADLFSLGVVLYELTTMTRAFLGSSELITLERITRGDITRPSAVIPGYPAELEAIVMRALSVDPDERFPTAGAMERELQLFAAGARLQLGHAAVVSVMTSMFDDSRRRFARSSGEVLRIEEDDEVTPVVPIPVLDTEPQSSIPEIAGDQPTTRVQAGLSRPLAPPEAPPRRATTETALIARPQARASNGETALVQIGTPNLLRYYVIAAILVVGFAVASAIAYR